MNIHKKVIGIISSSFDLIGGQSVQAHDLFNRLRNDGIHVDHLPSNPSFSEFPGKLQTIKYVRTIITWPYYVISLLRLLARYDVIHLFSASYLSFLLAPAPAAIVGKLFGKRIILNYHSGEAEDHLKKSLSTIRTVLRFVDKVVVPSDYLKQIFSRFGIETMVISNVVDTDTFPFQARPVFRPTFLVARSLEPLYNIACVLRAFGIIQKRYPDACLTVLGSGSQENILKEMTEKLNLNQVLFTGGIKRENIPAYYANHDIMLNASNIDNQPLSILEAFASGLPVVSTEAGGISSLITHRQTGLLVPLDDYLELAAQAILLLENQNLTKEIARAAHETCLERFTWTTVREQWLQVYGVA